MTTTPVVTLSQKQQQELPYRCSACGADRGCDCAAPAIEKATVALAADPHKSDRAIAKEIGVSDYTVRKARKATASDHAVDQPRVGLDGKVCNLPKHRKPGTRYFGYVSRAEAEADAPAREAASEALAAEDAAAAALLGSLAASSPSIREEVAYQLIKGTRQSQFEAVREAVADLYARLSKAGR